MGFLRFQRSVKIYDTTPCVEGQRSFVERRGSSFYLSQEKSSGWLGYIGDYTAQLYRGLINHYKDPH